MLTLCLPFDACVSALAQWPVLTNTSCFAFLDSLRGVGRGGPREGRGRGTPARVTMDIIFPASRLH